ncbi:glucose-1-phosphate adenylyltransferase [Bacillus sp. HMF5848]|uniref:sugar phosphate nucleotidyltransferase n=1 Tax=Bacillus sp. HMF5848 TaxID=2495421 RepID=UPI000F78D186|nr:sugar phosphate nucleotidyltransferase [Bacillus sp. HMF5848]RSK28290.1 glucose-1-phosphate adenylyltransferase [Bacillus sp. HMF5848]
MNNNMLGVIDASISASTIQELTMSRSLAAVPFAGRYRLIDFMLSNMVNSSINSVAIFPRYHYRSLMDHLGSGKQWDLNRKRDGLFFFPPFNPDGNINFFKQLEQNIDFFLRSKQKYAVIAKCNTVCNMDFQKILERHIRMNCDITEVRYKGESLEVYLLETSLLLDIIANLSQTNYENFHDVARDHTNKLIVCDYEFSGYTAVLDSIESYYENSLNMLKPEVWREIFKKDSPILTKVKDEPPTRYGNCSKVKNSMVANGCVIEGEVENSIIFRGVKIGKGTVIRNSIVMQKTQIGENCVIEQSILDKDVKVEDGVTVRGTRELPYTIQKGTVQGAMMNS